MKTAMSQQIPSTLMLFGEEVSPNEGPSKSVADERPLKFGVVKTGSEDGVSEVEIERLQVELIVRLGGKPIKLLPDPDQIVVRDSRRKKVRSPWGKGKSKDLCGAVAL